MKNKPIKIVARVGRGRPDLIKPIVLRGLIRFTSDQVQDMPVMRPERPLRFQESHIRENADIIIRPAPRRYWAASLIGTFSFRGWSGYVIVWGSTLMRVPVERTR